jgi:hypothetical protein
LVYPILINETMIPSRRISGGEDLSDLHAVRLYEDWGDGISVAVPALAAALVMSDSYLQYCAELVAGKTIGDAEVALIRRHSLFRINAITCLMSLGPESAAAVPALIACLADPNWMIRLLTTAALAKIGIAAADAIPHLSAAARGDGQEAVRHWADNALVTIQSAISGVQKS